MQHITAEEPLSLAPRQIVSIQLEDTRVMRVVSGRLWITIEADVNDYWLSAGQTLVLPRARHIVIEADPEFGWFDFLPHWENPAASTSDTPANAKRTHCL